MGTCAAWTRWGDRNSWTVRAVQDACVALSAALGLVAVSSHNQNETLALCCPRFFLLYQLANDTAQDPSSHQLAVCGGVHVGVPVHCHVGAIAKVGLQASKQGTAHVTCEMWHSCLTGVKTQSVYGEGLLPIHRARS